MRVILPHFRFNNSGEFGTAVFEQVLEWALTNTFIFVVAARGSIARNSAFSHLIGDVGT